MKATKRSILNIVIFIAISTIVIDWEVNTLYEYPIWMLVLAGLFTGAISTFTINAILFNFLIKKQFDRWFQD